MIFELHNVGNEALYTLLAKFGTVEVTTEPLFHSYMKMSWPTGITAFSRMYELPFIVCVILIKPYISNLFENRKQSSEEKSQEDDEIKGDAETSYSNPAVDWNENVVSQNYPEKGKTQYKQGVKEIVISCNITKVMKASSTRLVPPISWLTASGSKVKVVHASDDVKLSASSRRLSKSIKRSPQTTDATPIRTSILEISVNREMVDRSLDSLRQNGFQKDDIYRMVDKGPWILSIDLRHGISKLFSDLQVDNCIIYFLLSDSKK